MLLSWLQSDSYSCFRSYLQKPSGRPCLHLLVSQPQVGPPGEGPQGPEGIGCGQSWVVPPGSWSRPGSLLQDSIRSTGEGEWVETGMGNLWQVIVFGINELNDEWNDECQQTWSVGLRYWLRLFRLIISVFMGLNSNQNLNKTSGFWFGFGFWACKINRFHLPFLHKLAPYHFLPTWFPCSISLTIMFRNNVYE